ncbi:MAG: geranylgeranylglycerol-phosphate geranylgeranyltransferase [Thermoproteota archaeon]|nr:geranylgeranylglycerol-phosphate geranylgeranyltransferase [Thermoproteota archaeon]
MNKAVGFLRLLRPVNCLMMGGAVLVGELISYRNVYPDLPSLLGFFTSFLLTGASMTANDYWDRQVDKVNAPDRPIPSGVISERTGIYYASLMAVIGLITALLISLPCLIIAVAALLVSLAYSFRGKEAGLVGNFMVSTCVAIPLLFGGFLYKSSFSDFSGLSSLLIFIFMAFFANTGREITKGIADIEGDKLRNVRTIALRWGTGTASVVAVVFYVLAVGLSVFPWTEGMVSWLYLPFVLVADAGFVASSFILLREYSKKNAIRVKRMILLWMAVGLVAYVAGGIWIQP